MSNQAQHAAMLMHAIAGHFTERHLTEAFTAIVAAYYEEYTDATELDRKSYLALKHVWDWCFPFDEDADGREFCDVAAKVAP